MDIIRPPLTDTTHSRFMRGMIIAWIVGGILSLALTGGVIYVAVHFLAKYW